MRASTFVAPGLLLVAALLTAPAAADIKIAFIDPLSGGAATTGILAQKTHQFYIDAINAAGGVNGEKIELLSFDNKVNPQESLIQLKKALDEGARFVVQGNGSSIAHAITEAVLKYNERNPGKEVLFLNYAAVDPALTNEKCNFWHFRFDADAGAVRNAQPATGQGWHECLHAWLSSFVRRQGHREGCIAAIHRRPPVE